MREIPGGLIYWVKKHDGHMFYLLTVTQANTFRLCTTHVSRGAWIQPVTALQVSAWRDFWPAAFIGTISK